MRFDSHTVGMAAGILIALTSASVGYCQAGAGGGAGGAGGGAAPGAAGASGGLGGAGGASVGGAGAGGIGGAGIGGGVGAHQGHILTGPGATGIPQNYIRGAAPGMSLSPQEAPSGASNNVMGPLRRGARGERNLGLPRRRIGGGRAMGRSTRPVPQGGEENPAETLLDEMNGTHNGRRTGHAAIRPRPRYQRGLYGMSSEPFSLTPSRIEDRAVYFAERGAYEDKVYRPYQGTYRQQRRSATTARGRRAYTTARGLR